MCEIEFGSFVKTIFKRDRALVGRDIFGGFYVELCLVI